MVEVKFKLAKRDFIWTSLIIVLLGIGLTYAYGTSSPSTFGHSWKETSFDNEFCRYVTGEDCFEEFPEEPCEDWSCVADGTVLYVAESKTNGILGGRNGADNFCENNKPSELTCDNIHAFVSVSGTDEIRDMPSVYSYSSNSPLYWYHSINHKFTKFANSWADMLDMSIKVSVIDGIGNSNNRFSGPNEIYWVGSRFNGEDQEERKQNGHGNCMGWDSFTYKDAFGTQDSHGEYGTPGLTNLGWIDSRGSSIICTREINLLCACDSLS